jgi:hypothetical protein
MGIVAAYVAIVAVVTIALSRLIRNAAVIVTIAVIISVATFQVLAYIVSGYLDPFFHIAALTQAAIGVVTAIATLKLYRSREKTR